MPETFLQSMLPWHDFYMLTGEASATLIGLMFVALSLGIGLRNGSRDDIDTFVTPTVIYFLGVVVIAAVSVMPIDRSAILGGLIGTLSAISAPIGYRRLRRLKVKHHASPLGHRGWLWQWLLPAAAQAFMAVAAVGLVLDDRRARFVLAASLVTLLIVGVRNAWTFMIWVVEQRVK